MATEIALPTGVRSGPCGVVNQSQVRTNRNNSYPSIGSGPLVWVVLSVRKFVPLSANREHEATLLEC